MRGANLLVRDDEPRRQHPHDELMESRRERRVSASRRLSVGSASRRTTVGASATTSALRLVPV